MRTWQHGFFTCRRRQCLACGSVSNTVEVAASLSEYFMLGQIAKALRSDGLTNKLRRAIASAVFGRSAAAEQELQAVRSISPQLGDHLSKQLAWWKLGEMR